MGKDHWDAILASSPLNATAGAVTGKGYTYEPDVKRLQLEWDAPPLMCRPTRTHTQNPSFADLTGIRYGRMTVLGMLDGGGKEAVGALWVCRCVCGKYVGRRAKAIKKASPEDRCTVCNHQAYLIKSASGNRARIRAESEKARKW